MAFLIYKKYIELSQTRELIRIRINLFPNNVILVLLFATINNHVLFTGNTRKRIREIFQYIANNSNISEQDIKEAGEDLSEQIGRLLEAKIVVTNIRKRLEA